ncbi:MAG: hypothetical protein O3B84_00340 [Chloroflexi bacterium]|nr:hypothetical protein [Chloroflexota bacterium]
MGLVSFHRFLIVTAIVFCLGYAAWEFNAGIGGAGTSAYVQGSIFALLGMSLAVYLKRLARFLGYEE